MDILDLIEIGSTLGSDALEDTLAVTVVLEEELTKYFQVPTYKILS